MIERRFSSGGVEAFSGPASTPVIRGHASTFNSWYTRYEDPQIVVRERVLPGAFDNALKENQDVRALFNHDPNLVLGRTKSGTCRLSVDMKGLVYEVDPPDTQVGRDVLTSLRRGDVDGSSFAMTVRTGGDVWTRRDDPATGQRIVERDIKDVNLFDVSPVTYPAFTDSESEARRFSLAGLAQAWIVLPPVSSGKYYGASRRSYFP